jgi:minimal PKS acyl carrier protein
MKFTIDDLMQLLVTKAGLPAPARTDNPLRTFGDLGLDSLAFLQLQSELQTLYGVELPDDSPLSYTVGEIVAEVNERLVSTEERVA